MSNHTVPAAAEGMPAKTSRPNFDGPFQNAADVIALAVEMLIEHYSRVDDKCELPFSIADQVIAMLIMTRDACEAKIAEAAR